MSGGLTVSEDLRADTAPAFRDALAIFNNPLGALNSNTSLVTLSFGGNDLGFGKIVKDCLIAGISEHFKVLPYAPCAPNDSPQFQKELAALAAPGPGGLPQLYADIRTHAPNADVVVMGYPHLLIGT